MSREHADVALAAELIDGLRERLADELADELADGLGGPAGTRRLTPHRVAQALRESGRPVGDATVLAAYEQLRREVSGAGALEPLLGEPGVTDVLVNGHREVYVDRGRGLERQSLGFADDAAVRRLAQRLAAQAGRRLDDAMPHVDARLPDGTRLHAVLAPVARPGTVVSLRVPGRRHLELRDLRANGSIDALGERLLRRVVRARLAFVVSGGTGSGKTTLLGAMLGAVPEAERIVIVEDSSELRPAHPHVVGLEARPANVEGRGEITVRTLVRQALRMRPDRLVVGEVRGDEVVDLLAALNTGHEGGCGTIHANGAAEVVARIEALGQAAGLPRAAAHSQLAAALHVVLHLGRDRHGRRALTEVAVPVRRDDGLVVAEPALSLGRGGLQEHRGAERLGALLERAGPA